MALVNTGGSLRIVGGALGAGESCCCGGDDGGSSCCVIDGVGDPTKTTKAQCDEAGGVWVCQGCCCYTDGTSGTQVTVAECDAAGGTWSEPPCYEPVLCYDIVLMDEEGNCPDGYTPGNNGNPNFPNESCSKTIGPYHYYANCAADGGDDVIGLPCNFDPTQPPWVYYGWGDWQDFP